VKVLTKKEINLNSDLDLIRVTFTDGSCKIKEIVNPVYENADSENYLHTNRWFRSIR